MAETSLNIYPTHTANVKNNFHKGSFASWLTPYLKKEDHVRDGSKKKKVLKKGISKPIGIENSLRLEAVQVKMSTLRKI